MIKPLREDWPVCLAIAGLGAMALNPYAGAAVVLGAVAWVCLERYLGHVRAVAADAQAKTQSATESALEGRLTELDRRLTRIENRGPR